MKKAPILLHSIIFSTLAVAFSCFPQKSLAEEIVIGVDALAPKLNYLSDDSSVAKLVKSLVTSPLIRQGREDGIRLDLIDSLETAADPQEFLLRVRFDTRFHNGRLVNADDLVHSLQRCARSGESPQIEFTSLKAETFVNEYGIREHWVRFRLPKDASLAQNLSSCPIVPAKEQSTFESHFGVGTNLIGTGAFRLVGFQNGKSIEFARHTRFHREGQRAESVRIRLLEDSRQALTALRLGTIMAYLSDNTELLQEVSEDKTLSVSRCSFGTVLHRTKIFWECNPDFDPANLHYTTM